MKELNENDDDDFDESLKENSDDDSSDGNKSELNNFDEFEPKPKRRFVPKQKRTYNDISENDKELKKFNSSLLFKRKK